MQNDYIDLIEATPQLKSKKCKLLALLLKLFLQTATFAFTLSALLLYDYFIALAVLVLSFIVMGIVRSKIRNAVIPPSQREYQYNSKAIADWYIAKEICNDELETQLESI